MDNVVDTVVEGAAKVAEKVKDVAGHVVGQVTPPALPNDRASLMELHRAARRRRDAAPLDSHDRVAAALEIERIEIHIASIERAMDPPLV
jgi:hypothetical protein